MKHILIISGPNLNMLGMRDPALYGTDTLADIHAMCTARGAELNADIDCRQSNHEGEIVTWIQQARGKFDGLIINAGAYTHTSLAIHDALELFDAPIVEVHITDPKTRESFRHHSYIERLAAKTIAGRGAKGYVEAVEFLVASAA